MHFSHYNKYFKVAFITNPEFLKTTMPYMSVFACEKKRKEKNSCEIEWMCNLGSNVMLISQFYIDYSNFNSAYIVPCVFSAHCVSKMISTPTIGT